MTTIFICSDQVPVPDGVESSLCDVWFQQQANLETRRVAREEKESDEEDKEDKERDEEIDGQHHWGSAAAVAAAVLRRSWYEQVGPGRVLLLGQQPPRPRLVNAEPAQVDLADGQVSFFS